MEESNSSESDVKQSKDKETNKIEPQFCGICMEEFKTELKMFKSTTICSHSFCENCISSHVSSKISDGVVQVNCPEPECKVKLEPQNCRSFVPDSVIERWDIMICESLIGSEKFYCPFKECSAVLAVEDSDKDVTSAECPHCHRLFCVQCRVPWHADLLCTQFKEATEIDDQFVKIAESMKWQKCPKCKFYVQKSDGCEHIKCRCGCNFCYICGKSYSFGHTCPRRNQNTQLSQNCRNQDTRLLRYCEALIDLLSILFLFSCLCFGVQLICYGKK